MDFNNVLFDRPYKLITDEVWKDQTPVFVDLFDSNEAVRNVLQKTTVPLSEAQYCSSCLVQLDDSCRSTLIEHYKTPLHVLNAIRKINGYSPVGSKTECEIKNETEPNAITKNRNFQQKNLSHHSRVYFECGAHVFSIYKSILHKEERISPLIFNRHVDCLIIHLTGGDFAAAIFKSGNMYCSKTFHRYVVRAKQGSRQSKADSRQSSCRNNAGANLRRSNERKLKSDIIELLRSWSKEIKDLPLIFIKCPESEKSFLMSNEEIKQIFFSVDSRTHSIPFTTYSANLKELNRIWIELQQVYYHGTVTRFNEVRSSVMRFDLDYLQPKIRFEPEISDVECEMVSDDG